MSPRGRRYIHIERWDDFQHYKDRDAPGWIKDYTRQLSDFRYLELTPYQRALLHDLRLAYARARRELLDSTTILSREVGYRVTRASLERLKQAGFIRFSSRGGVQKRTATTSPDEDEEKTREESPMKGGSPPQVPAFNTPRPETLEAAHMLADSVRADNLARRRITELAGALPEASFHNVRSDIQDKGKLIVNPTGYALNSLRSMLDEGQYERGAA